MVDTAEIITAPLAPFTDGRDSLFIINCLTAGLVLIEEANLDITKKISTITEISRNDNQIAHLGAHFKEISTPFLQWSTVLQEGLSALGKEVAAALPALKVTLTAKQTEFTGKTKEANQQLEGLDKKIDNFNQQYQKVIKMITDIKSMIDDTEFYEKVQKGENVETQIKALEKLTTEFEASRKPVSIFCEDLLTNIKGTLSTNARNSLTSPINQTEPEIPRRESPNQAEPEIPRREGLE